MDERSLKALYDILGAITEITEETDARGKKFDVICRDRVYRRFIERNIGIIGEAMNRVLKNYPQINITSARQIVNTRNLVIHSYDSLDNEILWGIVIRHIPILKVEVERLIESAESI